MNKKSSPTGFFMGLACIFVLVLAGGSWWLYKQRNPKPGNVIPGNVPTQSEEKTTTSFKIYFNNSKQNKTHDCNRVYSVDRVVPQTQGVATAALTALFAGPTVEERNNGYTSFFSDKTRDILKSIKIENEIAYVNLTDIRQVIPNASTSCGSAEFLAEVESTLEQFPTVKKVILAIEEKPQTFYDWIQIGCSKDNNNCDETPFK